MRTSVKSAVALVATAAITLALAGCGGGDKSDDSSDPTNVATTTEAAPTSDAAATEEATITDEAAEGSSDSKACSLLDNDTLTAVTGADFSQAVASDDGSGSCTWDTMAAGGLSSVEVMLETAGGVSYEENRTGAALIMDDVTDINVDGADHAFSYMAGMVVAMDVHGEYVQVLFVTLDPAVTDTDITAKIASKVAGNM